MFFVLTKINSFILETLDLQPSTLYNTYYRQSNTDEYQEQDAGVDSYNNPTTTSTIRPTFTEHNPSIDMDQYCGACRYDGRRLHFKKYCKRDYSKLINDEHQLIFIDFVSSYSCTCNEST